MSYDLWSLETGDLLQTHGSDQCAPGHCSLHNPSDHPLAHAVMRWDRSRNLMVRFCAHGLWHPDVDDLAYKHRATSAAWASACERHECDGCCGMTGIPRTRLRELDTQRDFQAEPPIPAWFTKAYWAYIAFIEWVKSFLPRR